MKINDNNRTVDNEKVMRDNDSNDIVDYIEMTNYNNTGTDDYNIIYRQKRNKNNIASQKSRLKRSQKFASLKNEKFYLIEKNENLKATANNLKKQIANLKDLLVNSYINY